MSLLQYFPKVPATLRTFAASVNTDGVWAPGVSVDAPMLILTPQPAVGGSLEWLPENDRKLEHLYTWTDSTIEIHDCDDRADADRVIYNGKVYIVVRAENWEAGGFREIVMRFLPGEAA